MTPLTPRSRPRRAAGAAAIAALAAGLLLASCGDDDSDVGTGADTTEAPVETTEVAAGIEVTGAWARTSPIVATAGAAYFEIANGTAEDDALVSASVADTVAATVELHETRAAGMDEGGTETTMGEMGSTSTPMMEMVPVDRIEVPAGETVSLEPGGLHVMMLELAQPLEEGTELEITLTFEVAGEMVVTAVVGDGPPEGA